MMYGSHVACSELVHLSGKEDLVGLAVADEEHERMVSREGEWLNTDAVDADDAGDCRSLGALLVDVDHSTLEHIGHD